MSKDVKINGVWPLVLPDSSADEWIHNMKNHRNTWEMPRLKALEGLIKVNHLANTRRPIVMYIGAYKGDMAALLASWGADLVIMESTAAFWPLIKETWELNNLPEPVGFWSGLVGREPNIFDSSTGLPGLTEWPTRMAPYEEGNVGFSHLAESANDPSFPTTTIDTFVKVTGIVPDIITMDVEGSELEIMKGAIDTIEQHGPALMLSVHPEFMFHNHGTYERELHDLVRDRGYTGQWLDYDHEHHWLYLKDKK
jgi:FkbM family methyltransferase